nr:unnamed protein product [Callosobruchus chinensis]
MEDFHHELEPKAPQMQREGDSVDDFEHLGHDSSPLGASKTPMGLLLDLQCEAAGKIDTATENTGSAFTGASFQPSNIVDDLLPQKMDSNLLEMGDAVPQSAKQEAPEPKLEDFMHSESLLTRDLRDKYMIQSFVDNERQVIEDMQKLNAMNADYLDRYTDSDDDEFVRTKYENVPEKVKVDHAETFKDFDEPIKKEQPKPHVAPISAPSEAPPPVPTHAPAPAPVKEKTPEPMKEKTPEPVEPQPKEAPKKAEVKAKIAPADAEAIFKKMGLGKIWIM